MDNIAHGLLGLNIANLAFRDRMPPKVALWTGAIAANIPDIDVVLTAAGATTYTYWHRGVTHSFVALLVLAPLLAWVVRRLSPRSRYRDLLVLCLICQATHLALDLCTSWGIMLCRPFDDARFSAPWVFIIDLFFWTILALPLAAGRWWGASRRRASAWGIGALTLYYGVCGLNHHLAVGHAEAAAARVALEGARVEAYPRPFLPVLWSGVVTSDDVVLQMEINTVAAQPVEEVRRFPRGLDAPGVAAALATEDGARYPWFAPQMMATSDDEAVTLYDPRFFSLADVPGADTARFSLRFPVLERDDAGWRLGEPAWSEAAWPAFEVVPLD